ncbi:MAG: ferredoxin-NADP reductase [Rickettsiaceae bacterium]|jgi:thioredoxin reductase (NADPH)|nr:ferredoxin-NADP reductase [Rickettsiaceae bacterium]
MNNRYETDIVIVGAGPVGLFAIFQAGMLKMQSHVIDVLPDLGGQCTALYPEKPIYDIPAHPEISATDLIELLKTQAAPFNPIYHLEQQVVSFKQLENNFFEVITSRETVIRCKAIMIAAGCGAFGPNRPPLEGIEQYEGKSVFYYVNKKEIFTNKRIVIAGGGDSAVDWAIELSKTAEKIYLIHRREKFRASPESLDKVKSIAETGKIEYIIPYQLEALKGENGMLKEVIVKSLDGNIKALSADYLLAFFGLSMSLGPINDWGLNLDHHHIKVEQSTCKTSIEGIYAIGDIATYPKKLKLILTGFAEAASAMHDVYSRVFDGQALHFQYSTTKGIGANDK